MLLGADVGLAAIADDGGLYKMARLRQREDGPGSDAPGAFITAGPVQQPRGRSPPASTAHGWHCAARCGRRLFACPPCLPA
jgi:hypothetical protein